jgi:hypothetical protein
MILRNQDGSIIGVLKKGVLTKKVDSRIHKLRIIDGYGIDKSALMIALGNGCRTIVVKETDTGKDYKIGVVEFTKNAKEFDFGHGKQLALAGRYWELETGQESLL